MTFYEPFLSGLNLLTDYNPGNNSSMQYALKIINSEQHDIQQNNFYRYVSS